MKTILLKFAGPLQAWGTNSHFETRYTDRYPSKSAVIGILAASLGYRRNETENICKLNALDYAVRIDQPGTLLRDYHIAMRYLDESRLMKKVSPDRNNRTYVTNRYYMQDAVFVVAVGSAEVSLMDSIEEALKSPYFQPFLGRRSLPLNADFYLTSTNEDVIKSLKNLSWQASKWYQNSFRNKNKVNLDIYADSDLIETSKSEMKRDLVLSFSQEQRQHGFRPISKTQTKISLEHDAYNAIGG